MKLLQGSFEYAPRFVFGRQVRFIEWRITPMQSANSIVQRRAVVGHGEIGAAGIVRVDSRRSREASSRILQRSRPWAATVISEKRIRDHASPTDSSVGRQHERRRCRRRKPGCESIRRCLFPMRPSPALQSLLSPSLVLEPPVNPCPDSTGFYGRPSLIGEGLP